MLLWSCWLRLKWCFTMSSVIDRKWWLVGMMGAAALACYAARVSRTYWWLQTYRWFICASLISCWYRITEDDEWWEASASLIGRAWQHKKQCDQQEWQGNRYYDDAAGCMLYVSLHLGVVLLFSSRGGISLRSLAICHQNRFILKGHSNPKYLSFLPENTSSYVVRLLSAPKSVWSAR
jgi:hypothetical protein